MQSCNVKKIATCSRAIKKELVTAAVLKHAFNRLEAEGVCQPLSSSEALFQKNFVRKPKLLRVNISTAWAAAHFFIYTAGQKSLVTAKWISKYEITGEFYRGKAEIRYIIDVERCEKECLTEMNAVRNVRARYAVTEWRWSLFARCEVKLVVESILCSVSLHACSACLRWFKRMYTLCER